MKQPIVADKKIKVSQATIDKIKAKGMTAALKGARNASPEMLEGLKRMYGTTRVAASIKASKPADFSTPAGYKSPKAGLSKSTVKKSDLAKTSGKKSESNLKSNLIKGVGTAAGIGLLIASRGKATGAVSKLAPGLAKSGLGKAFIGTGETLSTKGLVTSGKMAAKSGKAVSQSQLDAMKAAAKAKGIKLPAAKAAAKATPKAAAKAAPKAAAKAPAKAPAKEAYSMPKITKKQKIVLGGVGGTAGVGAIPTKKNKR